MVEAKETFILVDDIKQIMDFLKYDGVVTFHDNTLIEAFHQRYFMLSEKQ